MQSLNVNKKFSGRKEVEKQDWGKRCIKTRIGVVCKSLKIKRYVIRNIAD